MSAEVASYNIDNGGQTLGTGGPPIEMANMRQLPSRQESRAGKRHSGECWVVLVFSWKSEFYSCENNWMYNQAKKKIEVFF